MFPIVLTVAVFGTMAAEAVRAARNERAQRARGGIEPAGDVYRAMRVAYPAGFAAMIAERLLRGAAPESMALVGAAIFVAAKALKWSAIAALGQNWTFRVIVVPRASLVVSGPYRLMRHPNYVGVMGEFVGVALMCGARIAGPIASAAFALLIAARVRVEERALDAILAAGSDPARTTRARRRPSDS